MLEISHELSRLTHGALQSLTEFGQDLYALATVLVWGDALTSIGAAFVSRMIPLKQMAVVNNVFRWASGLLSGSFSALVKHTINLPLNVRRWRQMNQIIDKAKNANDDVG